VNSGIDGRVGVSLSDVSGDVTDDECREWMTLGQSDSDLGLHVNLSDRSTKLWPPVDRERFHCGGFVCERGKNCRERDVLFPPQSVLYPKPAMCELNSTNQNTDVLVSTEKMNNSGQDAGVERDGEFIQETDEFEGLTGVMKLIFM